MKAKMRDGAFTVSPIALALACCLSMGNAAAEPYFDPTLLNLPESTSVDSIDLSAFTRSESMTAGRYVVTLRIRSRAKRDLFLCGCVGEYRAGNYTCVIG